MAKPSYSNLLDEEAHVKAQLADRIKTTGKTPGGAPIQEDRDVKVTTALNARLKEIQAKKAAIKDSLDPVERTAYDLYEEIVKKKK